MQTMTTKMGALLVAIAWLASGCSSSTDSPRDSQTSQVDGSRGDGGATDAAAVDQGGDGGGAHTLVFNAAASIGELLTYEVDLVALTYNYEVLGSAFGLEGKAGSGTLTKNQDGTYGITDADADLILLPGALAVGGLKLTIDSQDTQAVFAGVPALSTDYAVPELTGTYNWINYECGDPLQSGVCTAGYRSTYGSFEVSAGGTWESCTRGNIDDQATHPCDGTNATGAWTDMGNGIVQLTVNSTVIGHVMIVPSVSGGKVFVLDMKDRPLFHVGPGVMFGVKQQDLTAMSPVAAAYRYNQTDMSYGTVTVPDPASPGDPNSYHLQVTSSENEPSTRSGTFTRNAPWSGWLMLDTGGLVLLLPQDGVFLYMEPGKNTFVGLGGDLATSQ